MESESSVKNSPLIDEIVKEWRELCESRLGEDEYIAIDLDEDSITKLKETLADISNFALVHFIKLSIYQQAFEATVIDNIPAPPVASFVADQA